MHWSQARAHTTIARAGHQRLDLELADALHRDTMTLIDARNAVTSSDDIERGLTAIAVAGDNAARASRQTGIPESTLRTWRLDHAQRYQEIREQRMPLVERVIVTEARDLAIAYAELEREAITHSLTQLQAGDIKDASTVARNAAVAKGVNVDKMLVMDGRPTTITEHRSRDEIFRELERDGLIEGTAEDITTAAFLTESDETNARQLGAGQ